MGLVYTHSVAAWGTSGSIPWVMLCIQVPSAGMHWGSLHLLSCTNTQGSGFHRSDPTDIVRVRVGFSFVSHGVHSDFCLGLVHWDLDSQEDGLGGFLWGSLGRHACLPAPCSALPPRRALWMATSATDTAPVCCVLAGT